MEKERLDINYIHKFDFIENIRNGEFKIKIEIGNKLDKEELLNDKNLIDLVNILNKILDKKKCKKN